MSGYGFIGLAQYEAAFELAQKSTEPAHARRLLSRAPPAILDATSNKRPTPSPSRRSALFELIGRGIRVDSFSTRRLWPRRFRVSRITARSLTAQHHLSR